MTKDSTITLLRSIKHFFSGTVISRVSGLLRDIAMAFAFGTQGTVAAFLMAFRFAHLLRRLFGEGAMQSAFIPIFEKLKRSAPERATRFFVDLTASLSIFLIAIILMGMGACGLCLGLDLVSENNREVLVYTLIMLPSLLFICLYGLNAALLQCAHNYLTPSIAPVLFNIVWIAGALMLADIPIDQAMPWLSVFIIIACACQWAVTLPQTIQTIKHYDPKTLWSNIRLFTPDIKILAAPLFMAIVGVSASQINNALDVIFARYADTEGPAYLWYAIRLQQLPLALFGIAISGALLPPLTRALKNHDISQFQHYLSFAIRRSFALMLPMTAGIFLLGGASIQMLYGHGDFHQESIAGTTYCLWGYGAGLVPMTLVLLLAPAFYAQENFRLPTIASLASMGVNVGLNTWFIMGLHWGPSSVAWATSASAALNMLILSYFLKEHLFFFRSREFIESTAKICLSTLAGTSGVWLFSWILTYATPSEAAVYIAVQTTVFTTLFFGTSYLVDASDAFIWRLKEQ